MFLLAANVINPAMPGQDISDDIDLLIRVCNCYREADESLQAINRAHAVGMALEKLLSIIKHVRGMEASGLSLSKTTTNATASSGTQSRSGSSTQLEASGSYTDLPSMQSATTSDYVSHFAKAQQPDAPFSTLGVDDIESFIMNAPSGPELSSSFSLDNNMMRFMAQDPITPNRFQGEGYGMDICFPHDGLEPKSGLSVGL
jgi:hypothetical protein